MTDHRIPISFDADGKVVGLGRVEAAPVQSSAATTEPVLKKLRFTRDVMKRARMDGKSCLMSIWEQDLEGVEQAIEILSSDGGVENQRHAARGLRTPKTAQDGQEGGPLGSAPEQGHPEEHIAGVVSGPSEAINGAAQSPTQPGREAIHQAAKDGNLQYWRDSEAQRVAFDEWRVGGYVGDCPQIAKGSIVDYITDAIVAVLAVPVQSCSAGTGDAIKFLKETASHITAGRYLDAKASLDEAYKALIAQLPSAGSCEPFAWVCELAYAIDENRQYCDWREYLSKVKPLVPEASIRNLRPLYLNEPQTLPKWRHLKRGSVVTEIARGFAQVAHHPIEEMTAVVIYKHDADGVYWVRNAVEFDDGRFEPYPVTRPHQRGGE